MTADSYGMREVQCAQGVSGTCVGLALVCAVQQLELLPGVLVALHLGRDGRHDVLLPLDALLSALCHHDATRHISTRAH